MDGVPTKASVDALTLADFEADFMAGLVSEDGFASRELLATGRCVYYTTKDTPPGLVIKKLPDGRQQLVRHERGADQVIRDL